MAETQYLIIGGGYTGATAAEAIRKADSQGTILLVGAEKQLPYRRYLLSKQYLRGERPLERMPLRPASFYQEQHIQTNLGRRAVSLDTARHLVSLDDGDTVNFDRLLLATGATVRKIPLPGSELEGVHYLRSLEDCDHLRQEMQPDRRALIIGGGFIGAEVGASFHQKGLQVTIVEIAPVLWAHLFGEEMGRFFQDVLRGRGVDLRTSTQVQRLEGSRRVERAVLSDGSVVPCDFVLIGVGVRPDTALAEAAGLKVENGIVVDEFLETTAPGIFAGGDVTRFYHPLFGAHMHIEHWDIAAQHGAYAARNMAGQRTAYQEVPYFFSDLFELSIEWLGYAPSWDSLVVRRLKAEQFTAFYLKGGRVAGALLVSNTKDLKPARELIQRQIAILNPGALADVTFDLAGLS